MFDIENFLTILESKQNSFLLFWLKTPKLTLHYSSSCFSISHRDQTLRLGDNIFPFSDFESAKWDNKNKCLLFTNSCLGDVSLSISEIKHESLIF